MNQVKSRLQGMRDSGRARRDPLLAGVVAVLVLAAGACSDASSDPTAVLMAEETRAALHLAGELPSLPDLVSRHGVEDRQALEGVDRWVESWAAPASEQAELRNRAHALAAPALARAITEPALTDFLREVDRAVAAAEELDAERPLPEPVASRIQGARRLVDDAYRARERPDRARAIRRGLSAGDRLRSLAPERVAVTLLERAEEALRRNRGLDAYTPQELRRADRLIRTARQALESGDLPRAVRRAFYACQVLGLTVG